MTWPRGRRLVPFLLTVVLALTACGGNGDGAEPDQPTGDGTAPTDETADSTQVGAGDTETLPILNITDLTGIYAGTSLPASRGFELAFEKINEEGGITVDGTTYEVELRTQDTGSDVNQAVAAVREGLEGDAPIMIGPYTSAEAQPALEIQKDALDKLIYSPVSSQVAQARFDNTEEYPNLIALQIISDQLIGCYVPKFIDITEASDVAVVMADDPTGQQYTELLPQYIEDAGANTVAVETFATDTTDYSAVLSRADSADPDLIIVGWTPPQAVDMLRAADDLGIDTPIAGSQGTSGQSAVEATGGPLEGWMWPQIGPTFEEDTPEIQDMAERWQAEYDEDPADNPNNSFSVFGWDGAYLLKAALEEAGTVEDVETIVDAFRGLEYSGLFDWRFNDDAKPTYDIAVGRFEDGEVQLDPCNVEPV